jgi:hypothetical protein
MSIFHTFQYGNMSGIEVTCMQSFLDNGHQVTIFTYDQSLIDSRFCTENANLIVPHDKIFFYATDPGRGSISGFSNLFRYALLREVGDLWIDTDVLCLSNDWPEKTDFVAGWESEAWIGSAVLKLPKALADECVTRCLQLGDKVVWGQTGPRLVTELVVREALQSRLLPKASFYPRGYLEWLDFFDEEVSPSVANASRGSLSVHLWNQMITRNNFRKDLLPSAKSFFGAAVRRHGTESCFVPCSDRIFRRHVDDIKKSKT